jgi:hypothetical protein
VMPRAVMGGSDSDPTREKWNGTPVAFHRVDDVREATGSGESRLSLHAAWPSEQEVLSQSASAILLCSVRRGSSRLNVHMRLRSTATVHALSCQLSKFAVSLIFFKKKIQRHLLIK